jgi:hypothetical protein
MADPVSMMAVAGMGASVAGGVLGASGAAVNTASQQLGIQQSMLQTIGQAFGFRAQAQQYGYQANIATYQAAVADMNKQIAMSNANYARDVGEVEAQQSGMKSRYDLGVMEASQASSGVSVSGGSATRVRQSMIDVGYHDQATIRASAAMTAYGYDVEAVQYGAQADVQRYTATQNQAQAANAIEAAGITEQALPLEQRGSALVSTAGNIQIASSLVGGAGGVASKWIGAANAGVPGFSIG